MKALIEVKKIPDYIMHLYTEFSPIDCTAEGAVLIAKKADAQTIFHLNSDKHLYFSRLLEILAKLNIDIDVLSAQEFREVLEETLNTPETKHIYEAFLNDMDDEGRLMYDSNININNEFTLWFLKQIGFEWPVIDYEYINDYIKYFREIKYLE